jgi:HD superfamily phosphohydrolase
LHQLGTCHYVFHSAVHTRFEHSVGTYHLAGRILQGIKDNTDKDQLNVWLGNIKELDDYYNKNNLDEKSDDYVCELVKLAALCHDLGHGPFSHVFDDVFVPHMKRQNGHSDSPLEAHEHRSGVILEYIIKSNEYLKNRIGNSEIEFIKSLINPNENQNGFIYQIVSNNLNGLDVDKYDYLSRDSYVLGLKFSIDFSKLVDDVRVINNIICFPHQMYNEVISIFQTRYRMHKQILTHKSVITTQMMINDIMELIDPLANIYNSIYSIENFCNLTDDYVISTLKYLHSTIHKYTKEEQDRVNKAYNIWTRLCRRQLYKFIKIIVSDTPITKDYEQIICSELEKEYPNIKEELLIFKLKIGFVSGSKSNPLDNMYFYKNNTPDYCYKIKKKDVSQLLPENYQEYVHMFFVKNQHIVDSSIVGSIKNIIKSV